MRSLCRVRAPVPTVKRAEFGRPKAVKTGAWIGLVNARSFHESMDSGCMLRFEPPNGCV